MVFGTLCAPVRLDLDRTSAALHVGSSPSPHKFTDAPPALVSLVILRHTLPYLLPLLSFNKYVSRAHNGARRLLGRPSGVPLANLSLVLPVALVIVVAACSASLLILPTARPFPSGHSPLALGGGCHQEGAHGDHCCSSDCHLSQEPAGTEPLTRFKSRLTVVATVISALVQKPCRSCLRVTLFVDSFSFLLTPPRR